MTAPDPAELVELDARIVALDREHAHLALAWLARRDRDLVVAALDRMEQVGPYHP